MLIVVGVCFVVLGLCLAVGMGVIEAVEVSAGPGTAAARRDGLTGVPRLSVMPAMVMGRWTEIPVGSRVASVISTTPAAGDLVDSDGAVLEVGAGMAGAYLLNGAECWGGALVRPGDSVEVARGDDVVEAVVSEEKAIPQPMSFRGSGAFFALRDAGRPGVMEVRRGASTGKVFETVETVKAKSATVMRMRYRPQGKKVVLTLDDGPTDAYTSDILDLLKAEGVHAVFFMLGRNVAARGKLVKRMAAEGHELANHSYSHSIDEGASREATKAEIERASRAVKRATGTATKWFRPPGGSLNPAMLQAAEDAGHSVVLWDIDSLDWLAARDGLGAGAIESRVLNPLPANGSVLLFHDGGGDRRLTVEALTTIIRRLKAEGYDFCTLTELVEGAATSGFPA